MSCVRLRWTCVASNRSKFEVSHDGSNDCKIRCMNMNAFVILPLLKLGLRKLYLINSEDLIHLYAGERNVFSVTSV